MNAKEWMSVPRALADHAATKLECWWQRKGLRQRKRTILWLFALFAAVDLLFVALAFRCTPAAETGHISTLKIKSSCQTK